MTAQTLWDWRRRVFALYAAVQAAPDAAMGWSAWRAGRDALFGGHPQTPLEAPDGFEGLAYFPYDPALRFRVALTPASGAMLALPAGTDGIVQAAPFATTSGLQAALGAELTLYWLQGYGGGVFLPFQDATSGRESYGGGRYLLDTIKGADLGTTRDGRTVLDFNFAYNPSCAYSARYVCPLSPAGNRVPGRVAAGERAF